MFKLETMIYASEDGTSSVFTLNPALQKQLDALAMEHPEVCRRKAKQERKGTTYQISKSTIFLNFFDATTKSSELFRRIHKFLIQYSQNY